MSRLIYLMRKLVADLGGYGMLYNWFCTQQQAAVEYGYLYNWYAATNASPIAASGWHVPTNTEWTTLTTYLSGTSVAGGDLKETGTTHWGSPNVDATNASGFNGRGSGQRISSFQAFGNYGYFWTATAYSSSLAYLRRLNRENNDVFVNAEYKYQGMAIRLIKDDSTEASYIGNDGKLYKTVKIGTQVWLAEYLMETKYRNGDAIPEVADNTAWAALTTGGRCSYNNTEANAGTTKKLSSSDEWVVPSKTQWEGLLNYIDTYNSVSNNWPLAGGKLKETGFTHWLNDEYYIEGTNDFMFSARGGGKRDAYDTFIDLKQSAYFMSSTIVDEEHINTIGINYDETVSWVASNYKKMGCSVRLCNPTTSHPDGYVGSYTQNDGTIISTIVINGVEWTMNLKETKWSDGTDIPNVTDNTSWSLLQEAACCDINNDPTKR